MMHKLASRAAIAVTGPDAAEFLQNILTNDIRRLSADAPLQYNLLLSPQGQILHDVFVWRRGDDDFLLDVHAPRKADMLRRLALFKLRAKVAVEDLPAMGVYAGAGLADPRHAQLPPRLYTPDAVEAAAEGGYDDLCVALGVPAASAIRHEKDYVHDLGLERLNAIAWDKGCFIGQEVAARVEHRGLSKKALCHVAGEGLQAMAPVLTAEGGEAGEVRQVSADGRAGLAIIKKMAMDAALSQEGRPVTAAII